MSSRTRLIFPARFRGERAAAAFLRDNGLYAIGAQAIPSDGEFKIVIDTARPDAVQRYLAQGGPLPGVEWQRVELPS